MEEGLIDWESEEAVVLGDGSVAMRDLPEEVQNCILFRTSGSSGVEKWVAHTRESLAWSARLVIDHLEITQADTLGLVLPSYHVGGFGILARCHFSGAGLKRYQGKWNARRFTDWVDGVSVTSLVPTQVADLVKAKLEAPVGLRVIVVGGGALHDEVKAQARDLGWPVEPSYGMTETGSQIATGDGLPLLVGWEAKESDGQLAVKGEGLFKGYLIDGVFSDPKKDGWFLTQDRVQISNGKLNYLGRFDRQVKVLGELVDLEALESWWQRQLGGAAALVTMPDQRRGVTLHLFYEASECQIEKMNLSLPGPERVSSWRRLTSLPRSGLGKVDRVAMKEFLHL